MDLSDHTTLRLGGPAGRVVDAVDEATLVAAVRQADASGEPLLVLAGGSNVVVADAGFDGVVVRVLVRGIEHLGGGVVRVAAGEPWDPLVAACVAEGLAGVEALSGIPGSVGATPIQNVGAYGQEVAETITAVRALDRRSGLVVELLPAACRFGYRTSAFKEDPSRWVVLDVTFRPEASGRSRPIRYAELAHALEVEVGQTASLTAVREAVLALRRAKGMVLDPADPDTASAGSFFTNPILSPEAFAALAARTHGPPAWPEPDGRIKTSAAWLIEQAGFHRGGGDPDGIAISTKHVLALTNRGRGTTAELVALARRIATTVHAATGVPLHPEPVFVGHAWEPVGAIREP